MNNSEISVALADDHIIFIEALKTLIDTFPDCKVLYTTHNGKEMISKLKSGIVPDVLILDMRMPVMDGFDTALWVRQHYPEVNIVMLTMYDADVTLLRLLDAGVKAVLKKNIHPRDLHEAIKHVVDNEYYYNKDTSSRIARLFLNGHEEDAALEQVRFTDEELKFLRMVGTDMSYKEIARKMHTNPRVIEGIRMSLFNKLDIRTRVGLAIFAIQRGLIGI